MMLKQLKEIIKFFAAFVYGVLLPFRKKRPAFVVLYYHGLEKKKKAQFEKQMRYLASTHRVIKPSQVAACDFNNKGNLMVSITFDDGFLSILENAVPVLEDFKLAAGIFVPTGSIGGRRSWRLDENIEDNGEAVMDREQICELEKSGYEIFSHTVSHRKLSELSPKEVERELAESRQRLEEILGHSVSAVSYPHGEYNVSVSRAAERSGYTMGFTIEPFVNNCSGDRMAMGRFKVSPTESLLQFRLKVMGAYEVLNYFRMAKKKLCGVLF